MIATLFAVLLTIATAVGLICAAVSMAPYALWMVGFGLSLAVLLSLTAIVCTIVIAMWGKQ